jgi:hypothetical protein
MGFFSSWRGLPVFCWAFDTPEAWQESIGQTLYEDRIRDYSRKYDDEIAPILFEMGMKFNLGGEQDKSRLETTSRPIGVFDFSLASQGLYRVQEYYSQELAIDYPNLFDTFQLPSGIVPPNLVDNITIGGVKNFVYNHNGKMYVLDKRQKGTTAINDGIKDSKLKFATTTKDVYLKFKRVGGKVKYAEIYSLFYFSTLSGDAEYAIRHLPALMTAQYFESMGIKTRVYMTRFCNPGDPGELRANDPLTNVELPMYKQYRDYKSRSTFDNEIIFAPIIVKDFGQDLDWKSCLAVSQSNSNELYDPIIQSMLRKEISGRIFAPYGSPDQPQERYLEAFARYKEKYQTYVKAGIWKSKEIQEDSQLFFHSQSISEYLTSVRRALNGVLANNNITYSGEWKNILEISSVARTFFEWWMKTAAGRCRDTLMIMNAKEPRKEMQKVIDELKAGIDDIKSYLTIVVPQVYDFANGNVSNRVEREMANAIIRPNTINNILEQEGLTTDLNGEYKYENYLNRLITDATTYASGPLFPTDDDTIERLDERAELLYNDIKLRS